MVFIHRWMNFLSLKKGKGQVRPKELIRKLYRLLKSLLVGGTRGDMVAEVKYSVCPHPFIRPRKG